MSSKRAAAVRGLIVWLVLAVPPAFGEGPPAGGPPIVSPDELVRGQKGIGLSVFAGTEPERFEVEVIGVQRHATPELSYILARLSGPRVALAGVSQGMSGSPVYFDGRLAGAVSFSYLFAQEAIAGITPIAGMRRLDLAPDPPVHGDRAAPASADVAWSGRRAAGAVPSTVTLDMLAAGTVPEGFLAEQLSRLRPRTVVDGRPTIHWQAAGFDATAMTWLGEALGPVQPSAGGPRPAGRPSGGEASPPQAGGAVALVLVYGDLSLAAHGTITEVDGDRVLAFGHPVLGIGPVLVPMAHSEVLTTVASVANSFKVSNVGGIIGAFVQDREPGARGLVGRHAPTVPVEIRLESATPRTYRVEIAEIEPYFPALLGSTVLGALGAASRNQGDMAVDLAVRFDLEGHAPLALEQSFEGASAGVDSAVFLMTYADYLLGNDLEAARLEGITVTLTQGDRPQPATVEAVHAARRTVAPGERVDLHLDLRAYRGERHRRTLAIEVPETVPDGRYVVLVGDGSSIDAARRKLVPTVPETLDEALAVLRGYRSRRDIVILGLRGAPGVQVAGEALPALPASVRETFGGAADVAPLPLHVVDERVIEAAQPLSGAVRVDLEVRRRPR